ncbi:MAG: thermonuclease family protein [Synergistaceae bacterium]|nr:thermonuclease family protein [Synergistaceae bacterium]MBQ7067724.1 thermonuclease family protein [Synergistaceae bacterium]MBR0074380.1 thermonuclease family protein [Synergistaceae bacterium]MBR0078795.1 thermonuclease family protein [Synergistaceae bacterium]MBR0232559.1 thermonuclease family protein [Synergistaceae bacterium]
MKRKFYFVLSFILVLALSSVSFAHPGKLDSKGGHTDKETGEYHYHKGPNALQSLEILRNKVYKAKIERVVDGDTAIVSFIFDDGSKYLKERVRFLGVNTPETVHPNKPVEFYGKEASNFTKSQLTDQIVWLQTDVEVKDRYGRMLAYVWLREPSEKDFDNEDSIREYMFNAKLLLDGYAQLMTIQPNSRYSNLFVYFQREAREAKKGLWGKDPE